MIGVDHDVNYADGYGSGYLHLVILSLLSCIL